MKSSIFISGGSGLLALNWAVKDRDVFNVSLGIHKKEINLKGVQASPLNLEYISTIEKFLDDLQPSWVVHGAGLTSVEECELNPELASYVNVTLAQNMAIACAKLKIPLIHISTDHLFTGHQALVDENCLVAPVNVYGKTKADAEQLVLEAYPEALVIRTNFYGWGTSYRQSFSDVVINALRSKQRISLFQDVYYTPILAEVLVEVIHKLVGQRASGIFNVVGNDRVSKYEFGLRLANEFDLDGHLIDADQLKNRPFLVQRPYDMSLSNQKITNFLGASVGGLDQHLMRLKQQENNGLAQELSKL